MTFIIDNEQCIDCRLCINECPDKGISYQETEETVIYEISQNKCTECIEYNKVSKCSSICPVDCIINTTTAEDDETLKKRYLHNQIEKIKNNLI